MSAAQFNQNGFSPIQFLKGLLLRIGLARKTRSREGVSRIRFIWTRVAGLFFCLLLVGYFSLVTAAYFFVKHGRNFEEVRYMDLLFPHRWSTYEQARGDYYIEQAVALIEERDGGNPLQLLRIGLGLSPENTQGRILLAQIYYAMGLSTRGIPLLEEELANNEDNIEYLRLYLSLLFENYDDSRVQGVAEKILQGEEGSTSERNLLLAMAAASAHFNRGNYEQAERYLVDFRLRESQPGIVLQSRIEWEQGERAEAIRRLENLLTRNPGNEEANVLLIDYLWQDNRRDRALHYARARMYNDPMSYRPRLGLLYIYNRQGNTELEQEEIESFFTHFGSSEAAILSLASFAAHRGKPDLAERIYRHGEGRLMDTEKLGHAWIEANVAAGRHQRALAINDALEKDWAGINPFQRQSLLVVAHYGSGERERGEAILRTLLAQRNLRPNDLEGLAERMITLSEFDRGRDILKEIHRTSPNHQSSLTRLIKLDIERGTTLELVAHIERYLDLRKPSIPLLEEAYRYLGSDRFLFDQNRGAILDNLSEKLNSR